MTTASAAVITRYIHLEETGNDVLTWLCPWDWTHSCFWLADKKKKKSLIMGILNNHYREKLEYCGRTESLCILKCSCIKYKVIFLVKID